MMIRAMQISALLLALVVFGLMAYERWRPVTEYLDYAAVIGNLTYTSNAKLGFFSVATNDKPLDNVKWRDALMCRDDAGVYVEADVYESSALVKKPAFLPDDIVTFAKNRPIGGAVVSWRTELERKLVEFGKGQWSYQIQTMDWPAKSTPCYGIHTITFDTPIFGFEREQQLDSPVFWLIGGNTIREID